MKTEQELRQQERRLTAMFRQNILEADAELLRLELAQLEREEEAAQREIKRLEALQAKIAPAVEEIPEPEEEKPATGPENGPTEEIQPEEPEENPYMSLFD